MAEWFGKDVFKLGFGLMRLPHKEDGTNDMEQIIKMVDLFIEGGGTYFDTAYVYDNGHSEEAFKQAVVDRGLRDKVTIATKLNAGIPGLNAETARQQFNTSLERTGAGYFDYYLLHALGRNNRSKYDEFDLWEYVKGLKEEGLVKYWGFSFHDTPEMLDELLTAHPEVDFIQLQINYFDMENPDVQSKACLEVAKKHGKSVTVMEPVKGGALANPLPQVQELFEKNAPGMSPASWAIRYVAGLDNILTVLSGMSTLQQMEDNMSYMRDFKPLDDEEQKVIEEAVNIMNSVESIQCTGCEYCTKGCPMQIPIPRIFQARNGQLIYNNVEGAKGRYAMVTKDKGKASDCIQCGQCESQCPQHLPIIELLQECAANLE